MIVRILIADDEPLLRAQLREALAQLWPEAAVVAEAEDGLQALKAARAHRPDIAFLDIRMPGLSGIELSRVLGAEMHIVFVTAFDQYAVPAFEEGAIDFVLKPLEPARLLKTVTRLQAKLSQPPRDLSHWLDRLPQRAERKYLSWVQASVGATIHFVTIDEVWLFQADSKYTKVITRQLEAYIRKPIKDLLEELDPERFWQISRSLLVAVERIESTRRDGDGGMLLKLKDYPPLLPISQSAQHRFRQM